VIEAIAPGRDRPREGHSAGATGQASPFLLDPFARRITYLRLSVTDRCDFRCTYCMPERMRFAPRPELLEVDEFARVAAAFIRGGVRKIRLTGGEPLVRRDIVEIVGALSRHLGQGLDELTLTTNGSQLATHAAMLAAAGVARVNASIDTLDTVRFAQLTRGGDLDAVLAGVAAARTAGLRIKINAVALRGVNEDGIEPLMRWCAGEGHDLTLIETMPLGAVEEDRTDRYLPLSGVRTGLERRFTLDPLPDRTGGPARYVHVRELGLRMGFITPLTANFCDGCNRVRLTATGQLVLCLGQDAGVDLRTILRATRDDAPLDRAIADAIAIKPKSHDFRIARGAAPAVARHMSATGG
jgi:cyclic pyranopterin phosphate synthase